MWTSVHVYHPPRVGTGNVEDEDALQLGRVNNLKSRRIEERWTRAWLATHQRRIEIALRRPVLVKSPRPRLKGNVGRSGSAAETGTNFPVALLVASRAQIHMPVRPTRRRFRRRSIGG